MKIVNNILIAFILNIILVVILISGGLVTNSIAIFSATIHDITNTISIGIAYYLEKKSKHRPNYKYTYGYTRYSILSAFITTIILIISSLYVIYEGIRRIINPIAVNYDGIILLAILGILFNTIAVYKTRKGCEAMEENKLAIQNELSHVDIRNLIYTIRGKQVMLDSDVAMLYHYETKNVNKAVKRNIDRFPEDFCFQLTKDEMDKMWFQNGTTSKGEKNKYRSEKYLPYAFTEQGIAMLSGVLKNDIAIKASINIMRAFIEMRKFINTNKNLFEKVINIENKMDKKFIEQDKKFDIIFDQLQLEENIKQRIFFEGQIYDAYSLIIDIIKRANKKILIIDNYIDDSVLKMLAKKKKHVEVVILTSDKTNIQNIDIQKFNKEYPILKLSKTNKFHDRFIVIDNTEMYHLGASIKDLGRKCFGINKIEDMGIIEKIINVF